MIIGIGHRSGHGKDTLADFMVIHLRKRYPDLVIYKHTFARKIKEIAYDLYKQFGHQEPDWYDSPVGREYRNIPLETINKTPVEIWILIGTNCFRELIYDRTWTAYLKEIARNNIVIAADMRFHNEIGDVSYTIRCTNPRVPNRTGMSVDEVLADWDGWDAHVINDGTLQDLEQQAIEIVNTVNWESFIDD